MLHGLEHELRYALVAPLVDGAPLWVDLGCGDGVAAADALGGRAAREMLLVDASAEALAHAGRELAGARTLQADLGAAAGVEAVRSAIGGSEAIVTSFELLAELDDFVPCVDLLRSLGDRCTVVIGVPNDAFWSVAQPARPTVWGEGAFEELRRLLPSGHVVLHQVPLAASAIVASSGAEVSLAPARVTAEQVPSHFVVAFGPRVGELGSVAAARAIDADEERRRERERESRLEWLTARVGELERARS
jgi:hypothetical protein